MASQSSKRPQYKYLRSEVSQWKTEQIKAYLNTTEKILKRVESKSKTVISLMDSLSAELYELSETFREMDIQESQLTAKLQHGMGWRSHKSNQFELFGSRPANAWQYGVDLFRQWSVFGKAQRVLVDSQIKDLTREVKNCAQGFRRRIVEDQISLNADFIYRQKNFITRKVNLINSKSVDLWGLPSEFIRNSKVRNAILKKEKWAYSLVSFEDSCRFRHLKSYFDSTNECMLMQIENFRMFVNSIYYSRFRNCFETLADHLFLLKSF